MATPPGFTPSHLKKVMSLSLTMVTSLKRTHTRKPTKTILNLTKAIPLNFTPSSKATTAKRFSLTMAIYLSLTFNPNLKNMSLNHTLSPTTATQPNCTPSLSRSTRPRCTLKRTKAIIQNTTPSLN